MVVSTVRPITFSHHSQALFFSLMISRGCHSALYGCLRHNFLPEVSHGSLARVHVLCWHSGCRALGALRARGSPPSRSILSDLNSSLMVQGSGHSVVLMTPHEPRHRAGNYSSGELGRGGSKTVPRGVYGSERLKLHRGREGLSLENG